MSRLGEIVAGSRTGLRAPVDMPLWKGTKLVQRRFVDATISINAARLTLVWQTAKLADAAQQRLSYSAKGAVLPA